MQGWAADTAFVSLTGSRVDVGFASDAATLTALRSALADAT
jgi:hypothetical protein